ncbi:MAG: hypothetical protein E3J72_05565 [Planctomycetota bacterium]|nr:MAG: hypothetical protein E3J72_05565 [Planctomycetota bacterium]
MPGSPKPKRDPSEIDVRKVIEDSTERMSLRALEKKGFKRVRVLNEEIIRNLIAQAVEAAIKTRLGDKAHLLSETGDIEEESRKELKRLMKEHAESEQAHSAASARAGGLQEQIAALEDEIVKGHLDLEREREAIFQRGVLSAQEQVRELEKKARKLDAENAQLCASAGIERPEGGFPLGAAPANLEAMIKTVIESIQAQQDSEEISGLRDELKALAERDNKMADQMKNILREELSKRPVAGGMTKSQVEFAEASVESLFGEFGTDIETNIEQVEAKEEKSTGVGGVLERLKKMKKGDKKDG